MNNRTTEKDIYVPIQILPNEYNLSISNVSIKHVVSDVGESHFDYVMLKCRVNYALNGKKPGKRKIIFVSFDGKDGVLEIRGDHIEYRFTELGFDFLEICFEKPSLTGISVYVKEM